MINRVPEVNSASSTYRVEETYRINDRANVIPEGYLLRQCYDGYYQVFKPDGERHFFRIGEDLFTKLNCKVYYGEKNIQDSGSESKSGDVPTGELFT